MIRFHSDWLWLIDLKHNSTSAFGGRGQILLVEPYKDRRLFCKHASSAKANQTLQTGQSCPAHFLCWCRNCFYVFYDQTWKIRCLYAVAFENGTNEYFIISMVTWILHGAGTPDKAQCSVLNPRSFDTHTDRMAIPGGILLLPRQFTSAIFPARIRPGGP